MIPFDRMLSGRKSWFGGSGPRGDEILSTRVRLARNLTGFRFVGSARDEELATVYQRIESAIQAMPEMAEGSLTRIDELTLLDRHFLLERHLLSHDLTAEARHRGIAIGADESISLMVNEEDHVRMQCLMSGMQLDEAWQAANRLDTALAGKVSFAFGEELGYLTSCPTNVGTGLRASVLVHLPSLGLTQRIKKVLAGVGQVGLSVRGFHGEGSEVVGNFFQVSNQVTLGVSEEGTLEKLQGVVLQILDMEAKARDSLNRDARLQLEDKIGRAFGALKHARILSSQECMGLLSAIRFGVTMGLDGLPDLATVNEILICAQPAHLQKMVGREMSSAERNEFRAGWIQERLGGSNGHRPAGDAKAGGRRA